MGHGLWSKDISWGPFSNLLLIGETKVQEARPNRNSRLPLTRPVHLLPDQGCSTHFGMRPALFSSPAPMRRLLFHHCFCFLPGTSSGFQSAGKCLHRVERQHFVLLSTNYKKEGWLQLESKTQSRRRQMCQPPFLGCVLLTVASVVSRQHQQLRWGVTWERLNSYLLSYIWMGNWICFSHLHYWQDFCWAGYEFQTARLTRSMPASGCPLVSPLAPKPT